jgi:ABC-type spermidine/putrescine transport system permease subunit I
MPAASSTTRDGPVAASPRRPPGGSRRIESALPLLLVPLVAYLAVFYAYPVLAMLWRSFSDPTLSLQHYREVLTTPVVLKVFWITLRIATVVTALTLVLGYPVAFVMATASGPVRTILLGVVLVPFWISVLVRSYAWMVLLGRYGLVNQLLLALGVVDAPVRLLNTPLALYVGMVHILLPFMILPLYSVLSGIDRRLIAAAQGLGARPLNVFRHVVLPLSLPGVGAGCLLVFVLSLGFYVTPALLGGTQDIMIAVLIAEQVDLFNWGLASALSAVLLGGTLLVILTLDRFLRLDRLFAPSR